MSIKMYWLLQLVDEVLESVGNVYLQLYSSFFMSQAFGLSLLTHFFN